MSKLKFIAGIVLVIYNLCILIFAAPMIYPEYFNILFAIYAILAWVVGIRLIYYNRFAFGEVTE